MINSKVQEELEQKQNMISKLLEKERELELIISEREEEIQEYGQIIKENKIKYEKILK